MRILLNLKKEFPNPELFNLIKRKGIYFYDYVDSFERLNETSLPPHESFYSRLNKFNVTLEEYERAKEVWIKFNCKTLWNYTLICLKQDVNILADEIQTFRKMYTKERQLDPVHYVTSPSLT